MFIRKDIHMLLVNFFSSEGMDLNPDAYLFKWPHALYLLFCLLLFLFLMRFLKSSHQKTHKIVITTSIVLLLFLKYAGEAIFIYEWVQFGDAISSYSHPFWDIRTFISFQVCGVNNVLLPIVIAFNIKPMKDFVYSSSVLGGLAVLIYPVGVLFGDPLVLTFPMLRTLIVHFLLVFLPLYMIKIDQFRLEPKRWYYTFIGCLLMIAWSMFGNLVIDKTANNMFLMENPFLGGPIPFLNILPNGIHAIFLIFLVFLGFVLVYVLAKRYNQRHPLPTNEIKNQRV
jgi:hypothetical protein